jgi:hypothetical protein
MSLSECTLCIKTFLKSQKTVFKVHQDCKQVAGHRMLWSEVVVLQRFVVQNRVEDFQDSILPQLEEDNFVEVEDILDSEVDNLDSGVDILDSGVDILDSEVDSPDSEGDIPDSEEGILEPAAAAVVVAVAVAVAFEEVVAVLLGLDPHFFE